MKKIQKKSLVAYDQETSRAGLYEWITITESHVHNISFYVLQTSKAE